MIVLGISGGLGHDAAAALVQGGEVVAAAEEERFTRNKHAYGAAPTSAALYCLAEAGLTLSDVDVLALSWAPDRVNAGAALSIHQAMLAHPAFAGHRRPRISIVDHATCHAAAAFFGSGFPSAAIVTADGQGDGVATTIARGSGATITNLASFGITESLGFFYLALTNHLGFELGEEGKVMGLAATSRPLSSPPAFRLTASGYHPSIDVDGSGGDVLAFRATVAAWRRWFESNFGPAVAVRYSMDRLRGRVRSEIALTDHHAAIAATGQAELERVLLHLVRLAVEQTGERRLVLGGGVALNCTANGVIERSGLVDELYISPASGDAGTGLGAALSVAAAHGEAPAGALEQAGLGPSFSDYEVADLLSRLGLAAVRFDDVATEVAHLLDAGKVVGWFQGRMELGPRALGHRSILADPRRRANHTRVNELKGREQWRPLAPSLRAADGRRYVESLGSAPFMLTAVPVVGGMLTTIPAVVHTDGSCRPQFVTPDRNKPLATLLDALEATCGVPVVLNTSFNLAGEPIVCTPYDAVRTFYSSTLDALAVGPFVVTKRGVT
ncbi:Carbamoyltransferase [Phycicoccus elongatus Lp2]|uniref:Carbamoyltransferase n=1 Tax=Phycicoccus elongatus Lp2 TaxID=1193181 RepID=N0E4W9_9MICO|nr:carbamoyltransferase C-terminal domain-containing protein [Phycicoccus elongatus]CCH70996.1 Carbamoyltransferase [Phycicoccus elongatus Lp2]